MSQNEAFAADLLGWYDRRARDLPWRFKPGQAANVYHVWLSEIMLQQTTVATVKPFFQAFVSQWPRVEDLARADLDQVLQAWQGLGYYARARNLHACARHVTFVLGGQFPQDEAGLLKLPGVGIYTAAAISAIAYGQPSVAVDGNVERVFARILQLETPLPALKAIVREQAAGFVPAQRPGDYTQALMDLGAGICRPKNPTCLLCPVRDHCKAKAMGLAETLPRRPPKKVKPVRKALFYWLYDGEGRVLLERRPARGLLGGMIGIPSGLWVKEETPSSSEFNLQAEKTQLDELGLGLVVPKAQMEHIFTHFRLEGWVAKGRVLEPDLALAALVKIKLARQLVDVKSTNKTPLTDNQEEGLKNLEQGIGQALFWCPIEELSTQALPTCMKKVIKLAVA